MDDRVAEETARVLLKHAALEGAELERRLSQASSPEYWRTLIPALHVEAPPTDVADSPWSEERCDALAEHFHREGYFHAPPLVSPDAVRAMHAALTRIRAHGWPAAFGFVFDEVWVATTLPSISHLLERILGRGYRRTAHFWGHYVPPARGAAGWIPHMDASGTGTRITVWLSLSDAPLDGGCIYAIPRSRLPARLAAEFSTMDSVSRPELLAALQGCRAVPTLAGEVLAWDHDVIHWGAPWRGATGARVSISQEFIAEGAIPNASELPLNDPHGPPPAFRERVSLIARAILDYSRFEPLALRFTALATHLRAT